MKPSILRAAIAPFMGQIKESAAPAIQDTLQSMMQDIPVSAEGDKRALLIMPNSRGEHYLLRLVLNADNTVTKIIDQQKVTELINQLLNQL